MNEDMGENCMNSLRTSLLNSSWNYSPYFDATGKIDSSLLSGNKAWLGDFNECQELNDSLYCLVDFSANITPPLQNAVRSAGLLWGICAVKSCNESVIEHHADELIEGVWGVNWIKVLNATANCSRQLDFVPGFYATVILLTVLLFACLLGTVVDLWYRFTARMRWALVYSINRNGPQSVSPPQSSGDEANWRVEDVLSASVPSNPSLSANDNGCDGDDCDDSSSIGPPNRDLLQRAYCFQPDLKVKIGGCFSFYSNIQTLSKISRDEIICVHALRVLGLAIIILGKTFLATYSSQMLRNPNEFKRFGSRIGFQPISCCFYAVESFLLMSGLLLSYNKLHKFGTVWSVILYIFRHCVRLLPSIGVLLLIWTFVLPYCSAGPLWFETQNEVNQCEKFWWTNLLFIQNFHPESLSSSCVGWLWYLAVDFQLRCVAPVLLFVLSRSGRVLAVMLFLILLICSIVVRMVLIATYEVDVNPAAAMIFQHSDNAFWNYANIILSKPYCQGAPFLVGLWLGLKLNDERGLSIRLRQRYSVGGWCLCVLLGLVSIYSLYPLMLGYRYSPITGAICGSLGSVVWSLATVWCIYACRRLHGGLLNLFFSWRGWVVLSRLALGAYLFHGVFFHWYFQSLRQSLLLSDISMMSCFLVILFLSFVASVPLYLCVEAPVRQLVSRVSN